MSGVHAADVARTACSGRSRCHRPAQHSAHVPDASERIACNHAVRRGDDGSSSRSAAIDSRSASDSASRSAVHAPPKRSAPARQRARARAARRAEVGGHQERRDRVRSSS